MKVVWLAQAIQDLEDIEISLGEHSPRAAERVWTRIVERLENQSSMPLAAPVFAGGPLRRLVVTKTPYVVFYDVVADDLRVHSVMHAARRGAG